MTLPVPDSLEGIEKGDLLMVGATCPCPRWRFMVVTYEKPHPGTDRMIYAEDYDGDVHPFRISDLKRIRCGRCGSFKHQAHKCERKA